MPRTPEASLIRNQQRDWLAAGLEKLTPRERAAIVLRDMEDLPAEEVARRLRLFEGDGPLPHRKCAREVKKVYDKEAPVSARCMREARVSARLITRRRS